MLCLLSPATPATSSVALPPSAPVQNEINQTQNGKYSTVSPFAVGQCSSADTGSSCVQEMKPGWEICSALAFYLRVTTHGFHLVLESDKV